EECANRDIGHKVVTHAVEKRLPGTELLVFVVSGRTRSLGPAVGIGDGKILLYLVSADAIHPNRRTCWQGGDFLVGGKGFGNAAEKTVSNPTSGFRISRDSSTC